VVKPASSVALKYEGMLSNLGAPIFIDDLPETLNVTAGSQRVDLLPDVKDPDKRDLWTVTVGKYGTATSFVKAEVNDASQVGLIMSPKRDDVG
jgi:hypothetical protein